MIKEKLNFPPEPGKPQCFPTVSSLLLTQNTSLLTLLIPKCLEVFPYTKQKQRRGSLRQQRSVRQASASLREHIQQNTVEFFCETLSSAQPEDVNFRLCARFLEHHPVTSPPTNQEKVCRLWKTTKTLTPAPQVFLPSNTIMAAAESSELVFGHEFTFSPSCQPPE